MREHVIAPIILILTLRGPRRQAGPVIPDNGDVRGCMGVGLLSVTGFPVSLSSAGQSPRASCVLRTTTLSADTRVRRRCRPGAGEPSAEIPDRGRRRRRAWRVPDVPVGGYLSAPRWPLSGRPRIGPGILVVRGAGAGCAGGRIRCLPGRPGRASSRCRPGRRRRVWRRERAAAPARRPGRGRWR
jgi:hypothetical protein